jgi:inosine-uridine nucleoside N-ribohydrolase
MTILSSLASMHSLVPRCRKSCIHLSGCKSPAIFLALLLAGFPLPSLAQEPLPASQKVILDTDIGSDIDDAFALGLLLSSPEVKLLGVTTVWGDTSLRVRLVEGILCETGQQAIPVIAGVPTKSSTTLTQAAWARRFPLPPGSKADATSWTAQTIRQNPGQITLIGIGPLRNIGVLIERDSAAFHMLKRVVLMGGSIRRGYGDLGYAPDRGPEPESNIAKDIPAAQELFTSGVPIYMLPLDSTQMKLDEVLRRILFSQSTPLTDSLALLTYQWSAATNSLTPTLFDAMAAAAAIDEKLCPFQAMHVRVDSQGYTRVEPGPANAFVCLNSNSDDFFHFLIPRLLEQKLEPGSPDATCRMGP